MFNLPFVRKQNQFITGTIVRCTLYTYTVHPCCFKLCSVGTAFVYTIGIMAVAAPLIVVPVAEGSSVPDVV